MVVNPAIHVIEVVTVIIITALLVTLVLHVTEPAILVVMVVTLHVMELVTAGAIQVVLPAITVSLVTHV